MLRETLSLHKPKINFDLTASTSIRIYYDLNLLSNETIRGHRYDAKWYWFAGMIESLTNKND
ncbi:hypothetical protein SAMN04488244_101237 [Vibrio hangzhouensis]|uniref:Uncharacterized protein n=1 Tax=Vibrio hangzhouensis TaxID=462991 RepID=A0A1H5S674_9VIBR|nr:hypothetical protein SAMN04488244_101237 [Vibrio hangzhouensis]